MQLLGTSKLSWCMCFQNFYNAFNKVQLEVIMFVCSFVCLFVCLLVFRFEIKDEKNKGNFYGFLSFWFLFFDCLRFLYR